MFLPCTPSEIQCCLVVCDICVVVVVVVVVVVYVVFFVCLTLSKFEGSLYILKQTRNNMPQCLFNMRGFRNVLLRRVHGIRDSFASFFRILLTFPSFKVSFCMCDLSFLMEKRFGSRVHQTSSLCMGKAWRTPARFPGVTGVPLMSMLEPSVLEAFLRKNVPWLPKIVNRASITLFDDN